MKVVIEYKSGETEEIESVDTINKSGDRIDLFYANDEGFGVLEIPKSAIKEIVITEF